MLNFGRVEFAVEDVLNFVDFSKVALSQLINVLVGVNVIGSAHKVFQFIDSRENHATILAAEFLRKAIPRKSKRIENLVKSLEF